MALTYMIRTTAMNCPAEVSRGKFLEYFPDEMNLCFIEQYVESGLLIGESFYLFDRQHGIKGRIRKIGHLTRRIVND